MKSVSECLLKNHRMNTDHKMITAYLQTSNDAYHIDAYFYVGAGDYPKNIVRKVRAQVVGPQKYFLICPSSI